MKNLNLLIVEDNPKHVADLKTVLEQELPKWPMQVNSTWTTTLEDACYGLQRADIVMSDVFFPTRSGGREVPNGQNLAVEALESSKPVVLVTSTYHHGDRTESIHEWCLENQIALFDCYNLNRNAEATEKPWKKALYGLIFLAVAQEIGEPTRIGDSFHLYLRGKTTDTVTQRMVEMGFPRFEDSSQVAQGRGGSIDDL